MFKKEQSYDSGSGSEHGTTVVGSGASFNGVLKVNGSLRVDGQIEGTVEVAQHLTVGASGVMKAEIRANSALVAGRIKGRITAKDRVELEKGSRLEGDVHASSFKIMDGAFFQGQCTMGESPSTGAPPGSKRPPAADDDRKVVDR